MAISRQSDAGIIRENVETASDIEWWFIHGRLQGKSLGRRCFMVSLFRVRLPGRKTSPKAHVFAALISVLDPGTGKQRAASRIDRRLFQALAGEGISAKMDPHFSRPVLDELRDFGLPREFEMPASEPELSLEPFGCRWGDLRLKLRDSRLELAFHEPETGRPYRMILSSHESPLVIDQSDPADPVAARLGWNTYPRLLLRGSAGSVPVLGEAWFDHQWGSRAWFRTSDPSPRALGWDWLGFNLNDGSSWVAFQQWDIDHREGVNRHITVRQAGGDTFRAKSFALIPERWWTSAATRTRYPVAWRLEVPELKARLHFSPYADGQEIRVFGSIRAIYEGAGRISGRMRGKPVQGEARLECMGYAHILSTKSYLDRWAEPVDRELEVLLPRSMEDVAAASWNGGRGGHYDPAAYASMLSQPLWDLMGRDGKRWRGIMAYLMMEVFGADPEPYRAILFAWPELLHNASLIIDDLEDGSITRRGRETIHRRYGTDVAVSAANTAYFLSLAPLLHHARLGDRRKLKMLTIFQRLMVCAHMGQSLDLFWTRNLSEDRLAAWMRDSLGERIRQMYLLKTASPLEGLAEISAILARVNGSVRDAARSFARSFGLAYQLIDDVNNFSDSPGWRKQRGEDLAGGKITYLILRALQRLPHAGSGRLREILCSPLLRADAEVLAEGVDLVVGSGACAELRREARNEMRAAWQEFSRHVGPSAAKMEMRLLWESLLEKA